MPTPKLDKLTELLKLLNESITRQEFTDAFKAIVDFLKNLQVKNKEEFQNIKTSFADLSAKVEGRADEVISDLKDQIILTLSGQVEAVQKKLAEVKNGKDGEPGKDGDTIVGPPGKDGSPDTGDQIIDKINSADGLIKQEAVEGLDKLKKDVAEKTGNTTRIGWGAHPLSIQGLGVTIDKNTRIINFKGSGLSSVVRLPNGVVEVTLSGGAGGTVYEETPTGLINGSNVTYTVANSITTIYNFAINGQFLHKDSDYTYSGDTITFLSPLDASLSGKPFTITYA